MIILTISLSFSNCVVHNSLDQLSFPVNLSLAVAYQKWFEDINLDEKGLLLNTIANVMLKKKFQEFNLIDCKQCYGYSI